MSRHIRERHADLSASLGAANTGGQASADQSSALQQYEDVSETSSSESDSERSETVDLVEEVRRASYARAACGILDQHHRYSEEGLSRFLERRYPVVTRDHRLPLIIGATIGAQVASKLQVRASYNLASDDPRARRLARNALSAISNWNVGLRDGTRPAILLSHTCLLYTSPSPRDRQKSRMPSSA